MLHKTVRITIGNSNSQPIIIIINNRELEMLVMTSIHTLKKCKKKWPRRCIYNLMNIYIIEFIN